MAGYTKMVYPKTVTIQVLTGPDIRVTTSIETNALPLSQATTNCWWLTHVVDAALNTGLHVAAAKRSHFTELFWNLNAITQQQVEPIVVGLTSIVRHQRKHIYTVTYNALAGTSTLLTGWTKDYRWAIYSLLYS